ncbi:MAG: hypothetical protein OSB16_04280 [Planktomarina sp.]|nr:hypothetical protein [Planktomarina sp.]MDT2058019.1 hypothetical protein [Planktomarina sp.]MDT2073371.1 hypothetical protein [Planktomarina sp.]|tara:strand:- start:561 stop:782 length:222 start_codon:yes stop_codon:yes gene_type:complete
MGKATSAVHSCRCHARGILAPLIFLPCATDGVFDLPRFDAATITLAVGVWARSLLIAIGAGGLTLYLMLKICF